MCSRCCSHLVYCALHFRLTRLSHIRFVAGDGIYSLTLILNVIGLVLGFLMFLRPLLTLTAIRCLAGCYLLLLGIDSVAMAFSRLGRRRKSLPVPRALGSAQ